MQSKVIDIICPVFNKEDYVTRFLKSVSGLDCKFYNVIIIDDGSIDNTKEIALDFIKKNSSENIYFYSKNNGGVSSARNYGLRLASSEFVWFCDPDDEVIFSESLNDIQSIINGSDIDLYSFMYEYHEVSQSKSYVKATESSDDSIYKSGHEYLKKYDYFLEGNDISTVWNKWYRRENLHGITFDESLNLSEDRSFNLDYLMSCGNIERKNIVIYKYYAYPKSTLSSDTTLKTINDSCFVDKKNISILESFKDTRREKKASILKYLKGSLKCNKFNILQDYRDLHSCYNINIYPFISLKEFFIYFLLVVNCVPLIKFLLGKK